MKQHEKTIEILNDLIKINNDRITDYEKAAWESKGLQGDIKNIFHHMASESRKYVNDLQAEVMRLGGEPVTGTTASGKLYRFWADLKASFTGHDAQSILTSCEASEDAAQKSYKKALETENDLPDHIYSMILKQQQSLKSSHDLIKRYRDNRTFSHP
jgi:uncharacterized protein (TIGR02284 family)